MSVLTGLKHLSHSCSWIFQNPWQGVPVMAQQKGICLASMRTWVWFLALLSRLKIWHCHKLWCRPAAAAPIWPLASEPPYALGVTLKRKKKKKKKKKKRNPWQKAQITVPGISHRLLKHLGLHLPGQGSLLMARKWTHKLFSLYPNPAFKWGCGWFLAWLDLLITSAWSPCPSPNIHPPTPVSEVSWWQKKGKHSRGMMDNGFLNPLWGFDQSSWRRHRTGPLIRGF